MIKNELDAVQAFHEAFKIGVNQKPTIEVSDKIKELRFNLMKEENEEYLEAVQNNDLVEVADALGDMLYILCGTIIEHGLQDKIEDVFNEKPEAVLMGRHDILAIFNNENTIQNLKPNFSLMCDIDVRGFIASAEANDVDFVSRCFFPITGINEDPVTGSAHTTLIPYWSNRLNKNNMMAKQISERGGLLDCSIKDDRVFIGGQAVLYFSGTIEIKS